ncbi:MAG: hypothetical protein IT236_19135, partial [Bacteroidia bacterium]|nr:hypothetical protein [Bacteroidia bacterium]
MIKNFVIASFFALTSLGANAQENILNSNMDNGTNFNILYKHDMSGKLFANTRGYGFTFHRGKHVTAHSRSFYEIE